MWLPEEPLFWTHHSGLQGQHWLAIYINENGIGCFFDSFGNKQDYHSFPPIIKNVLICNSEEEQHLTVQVPDISSDIAVSIVFFLYHKAKGFDYDCVEIV